MRRFIVLFLCLCCVAGRAAGEEKYMRVVARNDGIFAQTEKIVVRNIALLLGEKRAELLEKIWPDCRVEEKRWQPDKKTPPAQTVYITLGQGAGHNWWGVLCGDAVSWTSEPMEGERVMITFPFFRWLLQLFTGRQG